MLKCMVDFKKKVGHLIFLFLGNWYTLKIKKKIIFIKMFENPVSGCRLFT